MNLQEQSDHIDQMVKNMKEIMLKKGDDYAGQEDRLFNFKAVAMVCGITPAKVCQVQIAIKISRITTLLKSDTPPNFESIVDTMIDLANYTVLMDMCLKEDNL